MLAGIARFEGQRKIERQRRANEHRARQGRRTGGSRRPFGFGSDGVTVVPHEADALRGGYRSLLAGVPLAATAREWNGLAIATTQTRNVRSGHAGEPSKWTASSIRLVHLIARNAGIVTYLGDEISTAGSAEWAALIDEPTYRAAAGIVADPDRRPPCCPR